ncbi:type I secretion system permease/ATPase [Dechloromonas sp. HYN0024]|uniref:type I secretion system permease/ATPase n=1 Tax=Dechloromonas sp. HYN0024 TaxID=2231055 RepID=UPI000E435A82|nr:type I secretion system permease/ATPase [Dechloromonas sp. HYN0024]AXS79660.1 type I secretion system permease/ATPase [Dechloromonas sp. HYN0024]
MGLDTTSHPSSQGKLPDESLVDAAASCLRLLGFPKSRDVIFANITLDGINDSGALAEALLTLGFAANLIKTELKAITGEQLPCLALLTGGRAVVITETGQEHIGIVGNKHRANYSVTKDQLAGLYTGELLLIRQRQTSDSRADELVPRHKENWFWPVIWRYRRYYFEAMSLAGIINILTLASIIFTLTVYDRVLPNQAYVTLWSLAGGVVLAMVLEFISRTARTRVLDSAGKKIDLVLGDAIFDHVLRARLEHRAQSSGAFANIFKEFEQVRNFVTSASLVAIADLPFALLFIVVTAVIAGPLAIVPLGTFCLVALMAIALQWPLAGLAREGLRESSIRHGTVIESLEGIETLKTTRAEPRMRARYDASSEGISRTAVKSATLSGITINATVLVQQLGTVVLLVWGVYLVAAGEVTAGAIIAAVQLTSRALAPLTNLTSLALRFQNIKSALSSLNRIMSLPLDRDPQQQYLSGSHWSGEMHLRQASFAYKADEPAIIRSANLIIRKGERVGVIGRMGSGKSTLLRLLAGLYQPTSGSLLMDGVDVSRIEPADMRATVLLLPQDGRLFHGSLRENIVLSAPDTTDEELLRVASWTGVKSIAAAHPKGFERLVGERGDTLSAGQRQAIALTRTILARPRVYLLDEPTSAMDQASEVAVLQGIHREIGDATLILVTHKASTLELVSRLIVVDNGQIVADGPKLDVLKALKDGHVKTA